MKTRLSPQKYSDICWEKVEEYCKGIEKGTIVSNRWIKLLVKKFKEDVKNPKYEVKVEKVDKVFKFLSILNLERGNEFQQFVCEPFQALTIAHLFGIYLKGTNKRKYQETFFFIGRKNGKTSWAATLQLYFLLMDGVVSPQSILLSGTQAMARRCLDILHSIIINTPSLNQLLHFNRGQVYLERSKGIAFAEILAADERRIQGYNINSAIIDEVHVLDNDKIISAARKSMAARENPMLFLISSAGDSSRDYCKDLVKYSKKVLTGEIMDDAFLPILYTLDDNDNWKDKKNWIKSNPAIGTIKDTSFLAKEFQRAQNFSSSMYDFLVYDLNIFSDVVDVWIAPKFIKKIFKKIDREELLGKQCYIGLDLSAIKDLTAISLLFPNEDDTEENFKVINYFIFPKNADKLQRKNQVNLRKWIDDEYIIECDTSVIDETLILQLIEDFMDKYNVIGIGYDSWSMQLMLPKFEALGITNICPIKQGFHLSYAVKKLQKLIELNQIQIEENPVMRWNFSNVKIEHDAIENWRINKKKSLDSIDGIIALTNALKLWIDLNTDPAILASERDLIHWQNK